MDDINWDEELNGFDTDAAISESRILWLKLARANAEWVEGLIDVLDSPENVMAAMKHAAAAEACFWRATGEMDAVNVPLEILKLREAD